MIPGLGETHGAPTVVGLRLRRVLVVDDAPPVRRKLLEILGRSGVAASEVDVAHDAEAALDLFARRRPTLVLCELVGEPARGLAMVQEMLALDPHAKVVLVTAEDPASPLVRQAVRAGVFAVLRKPLRHEAVRQALSEVEMEESGVERYR